MEYAFTSTGTGWTRVDGNDLPCPVDIRTDWADDGRRVFTGLLIGGAGETEISSGVLRQIRLADILAAFWDWDDETRKLLADLPMDVNPPAVIDGVESAKLLQFARAYTGELGRQPHRAMTAAAVACNVSRSTANRWAAICRAQGWLPDKED